MAHNTKRSAARQAVETLERPPGISKVQWRGVLAVLRVIAEHYPNPYPSQKTIASLTGYSLASIERYVSLAKANDLLLVKADAGRCRSKKSWKKTNRYLIVNPSNCGPSMPSECGVNPTGTSYPAGVELRSPLLAGEGELEAPDSARGRIRNLSDDNQGRQSYTGKDPKPAVVPAKKVPRPHGVKADTLLTPGAQKRQAPSRPVTPPRAPRRLVNYFLMSWQTMVNDPAINEALREFYWNARIVENAGKAEQYLSVHFLGDEAMQPQTEAQVQSLIDQFLQAVRRGDVSIRPDQSAWQSFTGMWGKSRDLRLDEDEAARRYFGDKA